MSEETKRRIRPVIVVPTGQISKRDLKRLNDNDFVVVEAKDPSLVRFMEPPPEGYSTQERAAISLCRELLRRDNYAMTRGDICSMLVTFFSEGTPLSSIRSQGVAQVKK